MERTAPRTALRTAGRALGLAVATLLLGGALFATGVTPAGVVLAPGFVAAWFGTGTETGGLLAFVGVNVLVWWAIWGVGLYIRRRLA